MKFLVYSTFIILIAVALISVVFSDQETFLFTEVGTVGNKTLYAELLTLYTWKAAHLLCREKGMFLASITTNDEKVKLQAYFASVDLSSGIDFWLSGTDLGSTGTYYWMDSGIKIADEPGVAGNGTCTDASTGGGSCSYFCKCDGTCSCESSCSGNCVTFKFKGTESPVVALDSCTSGKRLICQKYII